MYPSDVRSDYPGNSTYLRIDVSKTAQWEILFEHATQKGMYLHFKMMETGKSNFGIGKYAVSCSL